MADDEVMERRVEQIRSANEGLGKLTFPNLCRPKPPADGRVTHELISWAAQMYCYSLLSHFREMLQSFLFLGEKGHVPAGFVLCRCLFEMGAHAYYVHKHVQQFLAATDLAAAWEFLHEINMGSLYMREEYRQGEDGSHFAAPREIGKIIRCFDEWTGHKGKAVTEYSFLSEFAHPNMGAFSHYYEMKKDAAGNAQVEFSTKFPDEPLPDVSIAIVSALNFSLKLLKMTSESEIAPRLASVLAETYLDIEEKQD